MNDSVLDKLKKELNNKIEGREKDEQRIVKLICRQNFINRHPNLFKKLSYSEEIQDFLSSYQRDDEILNTLVDAANEEGLLEDNNNILFYAGTFMNDGETTWQVPRDSAKGEYDLYLNIENCKRIENAVETRSDFEKGRKIIFFYKTYPSMADFNDLRYDFFKDAVDENQEYACQRVLNRKF